MSSASVQSETFSAQNEYLHSDSDLGRVIVAFSENKPDTMELMAALINVGLNIAAQVKQQTENSQAPLEIERFTYAKRMAGGVMAHTWSAEIKLRGKENSFPILVKVIEDDPSMIYPRIMLAAEIVASELINQQPSLRGLPQCLAYSLLAEDQERIAEELPNTQDLSFHEPTNYLPVGNRTAFMAQEFVPSAPLAMASSVEDLAIGYLGLSMWQDKVYEETGIIHVDNKPANALVPYGEKKALPVDFAGFYHRDYCPDPKVYVGNLPNAFPADELVDERSMYAFARRNFIITMFMFTFKLPLPESIAAQRIKQNSDLANQFPVIAKEVFSEINKISNLGNLAMPELSADETAACNTLYDDLVAVIGPRVPVGGKAEELALFIVQQLINPDFTPSFADIAYEFFTLYNPTIGPLLRNEYEKGI